MLIPYDFTPPMRGPSELLKSQKGWAQRLGGICRHL